jgi:hypothetical protein
MQNSPVTFAGPLQSIDRKSVAVAPPSRHGDITVTASGAWPSRFDHDPN